MMSPGLNGSSRMDANSVARRGTDGDPVALRWTRRGLRQLRIARSWRPLLPRLTDPGPAVSPLSSCQTFTARRVVLAPFIGERVPSTLGQSHDAADAPTAASLGAQPLKRMLVAVACLLIGVGVAACSADDAPGTRPSPSPLTESSTSTSSPSTAETPPAWESKYSPRELAQYREALRRWQEYSAKTEQIYKQGKDTPGAEAVFRQYTAIAPGLIADLKRTYDIGGLRIVRASKPISFKALSIESNRVVIGQCTDYADMVVTQNGQKVSDALPDHLHTTLRIEMEKPSGHDWTIFSIGGKDETSCVK